MRVLLTGANGFIGRRFVETHGADHELFALTRTVAPDVPGVEWIPHDLVEPLTSVTLPDRIDAIVHLAQSRRYRDFPDGARDVFEVNTRSTLELLEYARAAGAGSFVYASSGGIYGYGYERLLESDPVNPLNFYFSSKYAAELLIANYQSFFRTNILRFFFVYGPEQRGMLVPSLVERVRRGEEVVVQGDPGLRINPIYVDDAVRALESALAHPASGLFNIAGDETVTMTELVELIGDVAHQPPTIRHSPTDAGGDLVGDNSRMRDVLGVTPETSLRDGLSRLLAAAPAAVE
jgi:UDP-glucose 4-epimerase